MKNGKKIYSALDDYKPRIRWKHFWILSRGESVNTV